MDGLRLASEPCAIVGRDKGESSNFECDKDVINSQILG